ncbi:MAG TPA: NAD-dependent epimerase/dehydratase family protein [Conexivisphaerales archaeon]|nr:NAD-dependent epimerase/dehydratase family protein [Conexivisphaerales archaeon]
MKAVVTGGAGFIGSHLVERLVAEDAEVLVIDNLHTGQAGNIPKGNVTFHRGRSGVIGRVAKDPDVVFHLGMYSSSPMYKENPHLVSEVVDDAVSVYEFARRTGCRLVVASTSSIYNWTPFPWTEDIAPRVTDYYTEARYAVERLGELYWNLHKVGSTALRFFSVYGEREEGKGKFANTLTQFLWSSMLGQEPLLYGSGEQSRDLTYVKDIVEGMMLASKRREGFGVFNLGTGTETSFNAMVELVGRRLGAKVKPKYVKADMSNYVMRTRADTRKAKEELGFEAKVKLSDGLDAIVKYYSGLRELPRLQ